MSKDVVLNLLSRSSDEPSVEACEPPLRLPALRLLPVADCGRYDLLLTGVAHAS